MAVLSDEAFETYKKRLIPVLYDWFMHYHLSYPTQTCRWGSQVEDLGYKAKYRAYLSEQVVDESRPNTLILAHIDVLKSHVASCEAVSNWQDKSTAQQVQIIKTIYHPGEVNKVRELPQHPELVVTHTDSPKLYVWNMDSQPDRRPKSAGVAAASAKARSARERSGSDGGGDSKSGSNKDSVPDLVLVGHEDDAQFPLACAPRGGGGPRVGSGGNDKLVLVWELGDSVTALTGAAAVGEGQPGRGSSRQQQQPTELKPRFRLEGHTATVGDLVFQPGGGELLISVADDGRILTWDLRTAGAGAGGGSSGSSSGSSSSGSWVAELRDAHGPGVNVMCVDWCPLDENLLVTGAQDGSLHVWDRRRMSSRSDRLFAFDTHRHYTASQQQQQQQSSDIIHVEWHPACKDVFASCSEDHTVAIWDLSRMEPDGKPAAATAAAGAGAGLGMGAAGGGSAGGEAVGSGGADKDAADKGDKGGPARKRARSSSSSKEAGGKDKGDKDKAAAEPPPQLIFRHIGHRTGRVTDFQWHPSEAWTLISVSENTPADDEVAPDGTLQVWRPLDLIYRPYDEAVAELDQHREFILSGSTAPNTSDSPAAKDADKALKAEVKEEVTAT
ncbi:hypothetical protein PLESTB_000958500 [Pleodorina starrii]|uniref:Histone-binding protein RBBP4-like N-terminal domain-containing protein n=1 Tax=Pleodorina starrii TaxID=330485 RepID=A0A9W6FCN3_9CHLO|nr:hypothetical protein PLESTM_001139500 [Pleodorina starrii]GLC77832.1 hypothetical protein PLESTB_000958500 [Pleodorina starrii]